MDKQPSASFVVAARRALGLENEALLAECEEEFFIGTGPGGQHRNKAKTAVRITHMRTGLVATATERRSQAQNRSRAIERLRELLERASYVPKKRKKTRPSKGSTERRLQEKKRAGKKKSDRRWAT